MHSKSSTALKASVLAISLVALSCGTAEARRPLHPTGHIGAWLPPMRSMARTTSGTWTPIPGFPGASPDTSLVLTDGTVIMHDACTQNWYRLTADATGKYVTGTWTRIASMQRAYKPLYFASQVLTDGRVIINGGEYNNCQAVWTNQGAIYDPVANTWTAVAAPHGWSQLGDAASVMLSSGHYMLQDALGSDQAIATISGTSVSWNLLTATGKADSNNEEGWTTLPDQTILTVDTNRDLSKTFSDSEIFSPLSNTWTTGKTTVGSLVDPIAHETGPGVLMNSGIVFYAGANSCGQSTCPGHTGLYNPLTGKWKAGPDFPKIAGGYFDVSDGPAVQLTNGHVLVQASPSYAGNFNSPSHFFDFDGTRLTQVNEPASAPGLAAYEGRLMMLPSGEVLFSSDVGDVEVYVAPGTPKAAWAPTITSAPTTVMRGQANYSITGTLFNGLTENSGYGDDVQQHTNYPIVRITNAKSGNVCFAKTHDFPSGISAVGAATTSAFDIPAASPPNGIRPCDAGKSNLVVIANGIASKPVKVTVK